MAKELVKLPIAEGIDAQVKLDGLDLVVEARVKGELLLGKLKEVIKGEVDDKIIDAVIAFLQSIQKPQA